MRLLRRLPLLAALAALLAVPASASAIVGGHAPTRDYPYMAAMYDDDFGGQICGSTLVAPEWILTAAHCVTNEDGSVQSPSKISFRIGGVPRVSGIWSTETDQGEVIRATEVLRHEKYDPYEFDIALVKLASASKYPPVAIADPATQKALWAEGVEATVIGYGARFYQVPPFRAKLKEVQVPMVGDDECAAAYNDRAFGFTGEFVAETMTCAGNLYGTEDSCQGDSGGPLFVPNGDELVQAGVVSWGFACGAPNFYGIYARVGDEPLYSWIQQRITPAEPAAKTKKPKSRRRSAARRR